MNKDDSSEDSDVEKSIAVPDEDILQMYELEQQTQLAATSKCYRKVGDLEHCGVQNRVVFD